MSGRKPVLVATALAAVTVAAPAGAQTYFAREMIKSPSQTRQEAPPSWSAGPWSAYSSGCSAAATQTRSVVCAKPDGSTAPDTSCAGPKPDATRSEAKFDGCGYAWKTGGWSAPSSNCSTAAQQSRAVWCERADGATVADPQCAGSGTRPAATQSVESLSGCGYAPADGGVGACVAGQRPHYWSCTRSDGATGFPASNCGKSNPEYEACGTYAWATGVWSAPSSTCGAGVQTRSVFCQRNDGAAVADSFCSAAGAKPDASQPTSDLSNCTYSATYGQYSACAQGSQTAPIASCTRSDGTPVPLQTCPAQTDTRPCTVVQATCSSMSSGTWYKRGSGTMNALGIGFASNEAEALDICNRHIAGTAKIGMCAWSSESTPGSVTFVTGAATGSYPWAPYLHLGTCQ